MFVIDPLKLNSPLRNVKCPSRSDLFKKSTFQGFKYKTETEDLAPGDYQEFRHLSKDEVFNKGQQLVHKDIADQTLQELQQEMTEASKSSKVEKTAE